MKTTFSAYVLTAILIGGAPAGAQDSDEKTKKKIMQALEKGVDALLKFTEKSKRAFEELSKSLGDGLFRKKREKGRTPVPPVPPIPIPVPVPPELPAKEPVQVEPQFVFNPWTAWNSFDKGAWVEQETTSVFGDMPESKSSTMTTLTGKNDREIKGDRKMNGFEMNDQVLAWKKEGIGVATKCGLCEKIHRSPETKNSFEEIEVAGKELKCDVVEMTAYDCKGEKQFTSKTWFSKEIPGWIAKSDVEMFGSLKGTSRTVVTAFGTQ